MKIADWVSNWFNVPGSKDTPANDRTYVFMATVGLAGYRSNIQQDVHNIHDYLEYLLLGCNPITNWKKESEFDIDYESDFYSSCFADVRESLIRLLDFTTFDSGSAMYTIIVRMLKACEQYGSKNVSLSIGERVTMLMLSLYLLDRELKVPSSDVGLIQNCLDLWYTSETLATDNEPEYEYASMRNDLRYSSWISSNINRLFRMHVETPELKSSLAYLGWFSSLVRAYRVAKSLKKDEDFSSEIREMILTEIGTLRNNRLGADVKHHEDIIRIGSSLTSSNRLFKLFRIKPPPVKKIG